MGGTVTVASVVGEGSAFHLRFPGVPISARLPAPDQSRLEGAARLQSIARGQNPGGGRQPAELRSDRRHVRRHPSRAGIRRQRRGSRGRRPTCSGPISCCWTSACRTWTAAPRSNKFAGRRVSELLPIIAVSASSMAKEEAGYREMFSGYLRKPFTQRELFEELSQFLPRANETANRSETTAATRNPPPRNLVPGTACSNSCADWKLRNGPACATVWPSTKPASSATELEGLGRATQLRTLARLRPDSGCIMPTHMRWMNWKNICSNSPL